MLLSYNILSPKNELAFGLVAGGSPNPTSTVKFNYATSSSTTSTALNVERQSGAGASTLDFFVLLGGFGGSGTGVYWINPTSFYTYSGDTVVGSSNIITGRQATSGSGITSLAIMGSGIINLWGLPEQITSSTEKYTYSSRTVAGGINLSSANAKLAAAGNDTYCLFGPGSFTSVWTTGQVGAPRFIPINTTSRYVYSNDTSAAGSNFTSARSYASAIGTTTLGIWCGGNLTSTTIKYTYSNNSQLAGGNLPSVRDSASSNSNKSLGILSGGRVNSTAGSSTNINTAYLFASDSSYDSGVLSTTKINAMGAGSTPSAFLT